LLKIGTWLTITLNDFWLRMKGEGERGRNQCTCCGDGRVRIEMKEGVRWQNLMLRLSVADI